MPRKSLYRGFAALDRQGHLLWGTIARKEEDTRKKFDQWNPDPTGAGHGEKVISIEIRLTK